MDTSPKKALPRFVPPSPGLRPVDDNTPESALDALTLAEQIKEAFQQFRTESTARLNELENLVSHLALAAAADDLTGTLRRGPGLLALEREADRVRRTGEPLSVVALDLDGLKIVNDREGHLAGDRFISDVAAAIAKELRSYDLILRYGGDEFLCGLPNTTKEEATRRFKSIQAQLGRLKPRRSVSVGFAVYEPPEDLDSAIARADADLYSRRQVVRGDSKVASD